MGLIAVTVLAVPAGWRVNCTFSPTFTPCNTSGEATLKVMVMAGRPIDAIA